MTETCQCTDDVVFTENGVSMFMWIGHTVDPDWIQQVFSVQSAAQIDIDKVTPPPVLTSFSSCTYLLILFN